jgi:predicted small lipoprotein YifL
MKKLFLILLLLSTFLISCGRAGNLYLPKNSAQEQQNDAGVNNN